MRSWDIVEQIGVLINFMFEIFCSDVALLAGNTKCKKSKKFAKYQAVRCMYQYLKIRKTYMLCIIIQWIESYSYPYMAL